jgi:hypothetical protein
MRPFAGRSTSRRGGNRDLAADVPGDRRAPPWASKELKTRPPPWRFFCRSLLRDLAALERMLEEEWIESGTKRIGAERDGYFLVREVRPFWLTPASWMRRLRFDAILPWLPGVRRHPARAGSFVVDTDRPLDGGGGLSLARLQEPALGRDPPRIEPAARTGNRFASR